MIRGLAVGLLCAGCAASPIVQHDAVLRLEQRSIAGRGTVALVATERRLVLDAQLQAVEAVTLEGAPVPFTHDGKTLVIELPRTGAVVLGLRWRVALAGEAPWWFGYATPRWLPTRFDSATRATLRLRFEGTEGLTAIAAGDRRDGAFVIDRPLPPFLFGFAVGKLPVLEAGRLTLLGGDPAALALTRQMVAFLEARTGLPLPGSYTQVFVGGDAAQEEAQLAFLDREALGGDEDDEWLFLHELAHQWFGVALTCLDFDDFWLNEGFATFFVAAWKEFAHGRAAYEAEVARWEERARKVRVAAPLSLARPGQPRPHTPDAKLQPRAVTYAGGALFLHRLRAELGELTFWKVLQTYVAANAGKDVTSQSLRAALEQVTGRSWEAAFDARVYGVPPG